MVRVNVMFGSIHCISIFILDTESKGPFGQMKWWTDPKGGPKGHNHFILI